MERWRPTGSQHQRQDGCSTSVSRRDDEAWSAVEVSSDVVRLREGKATLVRDRLLGARPEAAGPILSYPGSEVVWCKFGMAWYGVVWSGVEGVGVGVVWCGVVVNNNNNNSWNNKVSSESERDSGGGGGGKGRVGLPAMRKGSESAAGRRCSSSSSSGQQSAAVAEAAAEAEAEAKADSSK